VAGVAPAHLTAAEISCVNAWSDGYDPKIMAEWYPSGRRPSSDTCKTALIKGQLDVGDSVKLAQFLRKHHPFLEDVLLWSSGGLIDEGMKIGHLVRRALLTTDAPERNRELLGIGPDRQWPPGYGHLADFSTTICENSTCHCASACFLVWAAGAPFRLGQLIGLHRPTIRATAFSDMPPERASIFYRQSLTDMAKYLTEMEVPRRFIDMMTDTSSNDIRWINRMAVSFQEVPSISEWLDTACGRYLEGRTPEESGKILDCRITKTKNARDSIRDIR
jgi:hypothetical protein